MATPTRAFVPPLEAPFNGVEGAAWQDAHPPEWDEEGCVAARFGGHGPRTARASAVHHGVDGWYFGGAADQQEEAEAAASVEPSPSSQQGLEQAECSTPQRDADEERARGWVAERLNG